MSKIKDETGKRYGRLTVIERAETSADRRMAYWLCKCDCGNMKVARGVDLRRGGTRSCGCLQRENGRKNVVAGYHNLKDLTGERFGKLVVLRTGSGSKHGAKWVCKCDCGNIVEVYGKSLRSGNTKTCGCSKKSKKQETNDAE